MSMPPSEIARRLHLMVDDWLTHCDDVLDTIAATMLYKVVIRSHADPNYMITLVVGTEPTDPNDPDLQDDGDDDDAE